MGKELENEAGARVGYMLVLEGGHIVRWCLIRDSKGWRSEPNTISLYDHLPNFQTTYNCGGHSQIYSFPLLF